MFPKVFLSGNNFLSKAGELLWLHLMIGCPRATSCGGARVLPSDVRVPDAGADRHVFRVVKNVCGALPLWNSCLTASA